MPRDLDEDQIEATIRRVAETQAPRTGDGPGDVDKKSSGDEHAAANKALDATMRRLESEKAARKAAGERAAAEAASASAGERDQDPIEATVKRVQAEQAARAAAEADAEGAEPAIDSPQATADIDDAIEATVKRVQAEQAARAAAEADAEGAEPAIDPPQAALDAEDPIEATVRRVQEEKAAREAEEQAAASVDPVPDVVDDDAGAPDEDPIEATIRRVQAEWAARESETHEPANEASEAPRAIEAPSSLDTAPASAGEQLPTPTPARAASGPREPLGASLETVARLEQRIEATNAAVCELATRLDALLPLFERLSAQAAAAAQPQPRQPADEGDWDEAPRISSMPVAMPPRPAIWRDPSPLTATAERLIEPEVIDTWPLPKPLPPIHAEPPKRGFDLLPRTYRITVEDKRRGVDLVPLHRALLSMDGVKDMSLLSYNNGVAIVALETTVDIEPESLGTFVSRAMSRGAKVEQHNETTMVVKLAEE